MRKLVLITGGTSGLGRAMALSLAENYDLALGYKGNIERAQKTVSEIEKIHPQAQVRTYKIPLQDESSCQKLAQAVLKDFPKNPLYGFIHCAGATSTSLYATTPLEDQLQLIQEHLVSAMAITHLLLPQMYKNKLGRIVFMSSVSARFGYRGHAGYAAAKSGLEAFARTLALEVAHRGITVNCVAPGLINTPLTEKKIKKMDAATLKRVNPTGSLPQPEDVASMVEYLVSEKGKFITGTSIPVDGGQALGDLIS